MSRFFEGQSAEIVTVLTSMPPTPTGILATLTRVGSKIAVGNTSFEQSKRNLMEYYSFADRSSCISFVCTLFPNVKHKVLQRIANNLENTPQFVYDGVAMVTNHLRIVVRESLACAQTGKELGIVWNWAVELFRTNGYGQMPSCVHGAYRAYYLRFLVEELSQSIASGRFGAQMPELPRYRCEDPDNPDKNIAALTEFGIALYQDPRSENAQAAIEFLLEIGKRLQFTNPSCTPNGGDCRDIELQRLYEALNLYNLNEQDAILRAFASPNCDTAANALVAAAGVGGRIPTSFWDALSMEQNFHEEKYVNFDVKSLLYDTDMVAAEPFQQQIVNRLEEICNSGDVRSALDAFKNHTFFKDLPRDPAIVLRIFNRVFCPSNYSSLPDLIRAVYDTVFEEFPRNKAFVAFLSLCRYPWTQGECARIALAIGKRLGAFTDTGMFALSLLALRNAGESNGKTQVSILENGTTEVRSFVASAGTPRGHHALPGVKFTNSIPWIYLYTDMKCDAESNVTVLEAQIACSV